MLHLVTGGSGFLGHLITKRLLEEGEAVRTLDIRDDETCPAGAKFFQSDVRDRAGVAKALEGVDVVHHTAAAVPLTKAGRGFRQCNVEGSRVVAQEAVRAHVRFFVHMSSSAVYGIPKVCPVKEQDVPHPAEQYGRSKLAGELAVKEVCQEGNLPLILIRPRTILGQGRLGIFQILFKWIREGKRVYLVGRGDNKIQFVHANDLINAYMLAVRLGKPGVYHVGTNRYGTMRSMLETLIAHAKSASKIHALPVGPVVFGLGVLDALGLSPFAPWHYLGIHKDFYFDDDHALQLNWKPKYSNAEMLCESYDDYLKQGGVAQVAAGGRSPHRRAVGGWLIDLIEKLP